MRLSVREHVGGQRRRRRQLREPRPGQHHREVGAILVHVTAADRVRTPSADGVGQAIDQPLLAEVVVEHHHAARRQVLAHRLERLLREHVALEPHAGEARLHRQRVDQREHDEVVLLRRRPQEMPGVVVDDGDARIAGTAGRDAARRRGAG